MQFPDVIVPLQWDDMHRGGQEDSPEQRLHQALLLDAIHQLSRYRHLDHHQAREVVGEIIDWIENADDPIYPISFRTCAEAAFPKLDPDALREALLKRNHRVYMRRNFVSHKHRV